MTQRYDSVQVSPTPGVGNETAYASGAVVDGEYLYLYGIRPIRRPTARPGTCTHHPPRLGRGGPGAVGRRLLPRHVAATATTPGPAGTRGRRPSPPPPTSSPTPRRPAGDGLSVHWQPELGRYVMIHADTPVRHLDRPRHPHLAHPVGPWSEAITVAPNAVVRPRLAPTPPARAPCRAARSRSTPSSQAAATLWFSYVREGDLATASGQPVTVKGEPGMTVRLASVPFDTLPRPLRGRGGPPRQTQACGGDRRRCVGDARWTAPALVSGSQILGYQVTPYIGSVAQRPVAFSGTGRSGVVRGLDNARDYTFSVRAVTAAGPGPASARTATVTPRVPPGRPRASPRPGRRHGDGELDGPANTGGAAITGYRVTPIRDGVPRRRGYLNQTATSKVIASLTNGASYTFTVQAVTDLGTSAASAADRRGQPVRRAARAERRRGRHAARRRRGADLGCRQRRRAARRSPAIGSRPTSGPPPRRRST